MDITSTRISGITSIRDPNDVVNKQYIDNKNLPTTINQTNKFLYTDGDNISWEFIQNILEYKSPGSYNFNIPPYAKQLLVEVRGAGGGGASGNLDGSGYKNNNLLIFSKVQKYLYGYVPDGCLTYGNNFYLLGMPGYYPTSLQASTNATNWIIRTTGIPSYTRSVKYLNNLYFVGTDGGIGVSTDTIVWTARTSGINREIKSFSYGNGVYVATPTQVYSTPPIISSTDTIVWVIRTVNVGSDLRIVNFGNNLFFGAGTNFIVTSTNAIVWTLRTSPFSSSTELNGSYMYSSLYANNLYIVSSTFCIAVSTDAIVWTARTSGYKTPYYLHDLTYADGLYFGVYYDNKILISTDTIVWKVFTSPSVNEYLFSATFGDNKILIGTNNNPLVSPRNVSGFSGGSGGSGAFGSWQISKDQIEGSTLSVTVGQGGTGGRIGEPTIWTLRTSGTFDKFNAITYGNGTYVAGGANGTLITSTDTTVWTARTARNVNSINTLYYANNLYIAGGSDVSVATSILFVSTDSIVWTLRTTGTGSVNSIFYSPDNNLYLLASFDPGIISYSTDAIVWQSSTLPFSNTMNTIAYASNKAEKYMISGESNLTYTSTNGQFWSLRTTGFVAGGNASTSSIYDGNSYIVSTAFGNLISSTNGIVWTARTSGTTNSFNALIYVNNTYVASGSNGIIRNSTNAIVWIARTSNTTNNLYSLISNNNLFVAAGLNGTITTASFFQAAATSGSASSVSWTGPNSTTYTVSANGGGGASEIVLGGQLASAPEVNTNYILASPGLNGVDGAVLEGTSNNGLGEQVQYQSVSGGSGAFTDSLGGNPGIIYQGNASTFENVEKNVFGSGGKGGYASKTLSTIWFARTSSIYFQTFKSYTFGNGIHLLGGSNGQLISSTDTIVWTTRTSLTYTNINALAFGQVYVLGDLNSNLLTSDDGVVWNVRTTGGSGSIQSILYANNTYVIATSNGRISVSTNAIVWTTRTVAAGINNDYRSLTYGNNTYVLAANNLDIISSTDTVVWTLRTTGTGGNYRSLTYGNGLYVACGEPMYSGPMVGNSAIMTSTDSIVWEVRTAYSSLQPYQTMYSIVYTGKYFVVFGSGLYGFISKDGVLWNSVKVSEATYGGGEGYVGYGDQKLITFGSNNNVFVSFDSMQVANGSKGFAGGSGGGGGFLYDSETNTKLVGNGGDGGDGYVKITWW